MMKHPITVMAFAMFFAIITFTAPTVFATNEPMKMHKDHGAADMAKGMNENMQDSNAMDKHKNHDQLQQQQKELASKVRVDEKLGQIIDLETMFFDENGKQIKMATIFDKPVVILPIYFFCPTICSFLQADLAEVLNKVNQLPGKDFNVVCVSFSDDEHYQHAADAKKNYVKLLKREMPLKNWFYLTGTRDNILRLTQSMGFYFVKQEKHLYVHPNVLIVLADDGMITRYVYGPNFLPFDVGMALVEADRGETGISIKRGVMSFCFNYDPEKKTYVFNVFRIAGTTILAFLAGFVLLLVFYPKKRKKE
jgi:protein SCO1